MTVEDQVQKEIIKQLRNIKGHIDGIEKMVNEEKQCGDLLIQIAAIKSSINKVGIYILENYTSQCIRQALEQETDGQKEAVNRIIETISSFIK